MQVDRLKRRQFITLIGSAAVAWPCNGLAQSPPKRPLIGFLGASSKTAGARYYSGFLSGMRDLGYVEGRDYGFQDRYADGDVSRMPSLAEELVGLKPDVIVASATAGALAAKQASTSIPIVGVNLTDPVNFGLVVSEARPGANVTGNLFQLEGMAGKQVEIALDLMPGTSKVGVLVDVDNPSNTVQLREVEAATGKFGMSAVVLASARFLDAGRRIASFALASRLPTVLTFRELVEDGGLISYGVEVRQNYRRAAYFVDRILKGAKPDDLPVEFPTKVELVVNLTTAEAIGLTMPPTLLARADEVIE
jgi:putative tryptophan/tyrosine transport system substrate-binding protein